jgi:hypothetical protein
MPKPVRTHPRGAACITMICSLGLLVACCGCPGMLWKPEPPKAVSIVIQADGSITVDGEPAGPREQWAELLKKKAETRKAALRTAPAPAVPQPRAQRPREVLINVASPEKTKYEVFCQVLLACDMAYLSDLDLEGVPFTPPTSSSPRAGGDMFGQTPGPAFLPMEVRSTADLDKLREHAKELDRGGILLAGTFDCPMDLVIAAAKAIHEIGAPVAFAIPYDDAAGTNAAPLVLKYAGVDGRGNFVPRFERLNKDDKVKVHTIAFQYKTREPVLKQIAAENGGVYRFVSEHDLAALSENAR